MLYIMLTAGLLISLLGCATVAAGAGSYDGVQQELDSPPSIYGSWLDSQSLVEEQLMLESSTGGPGGTNNTNGTGGPTGPSVSNGEKETLNNPSVSRFRNTVEGEPLVIHKFVNRVIVDEELVKITLHAKTADALGDAGFTLEVENHYQPLTPLGNDNYLYITPVIGTWYVNGVKIDPQTEGYVYPAESGTIYLYFDGLSTIDELSYVRGSFEIYLISDWWNPILVCPFYQE